MIKRIAWFGLALISAHAAADTPASSMVRYAQQSPAREFVVATETGILHRLHKLNPGKTFFPVSERAVCQFMKKITVEKVLRCLKEEVFETRVGKRIEPLAPSANPQRFTDAAKVEKWFRRNCTDVLRRECSAQEKGDFIAWLNQIK